MNVKKIMPSFLAALIVLRVMTETRCLIFLRNAATRWRMCVLPLARCGKIIMTVIGMRGGMAGRQGRQDPKEAALAEARQGCDADPTRSTPGASERWMALYPRPLARYRQ